MVARSENRVWVGDVRVCGVGLDQQSRCVHYHGGRDVIAVALPCCEDFFGCYRCHDAVADHDRERWSDAADGAALCGACGRVLGLDTYFERLSSDAACPACGAAFNPGCLTHRGRYVRE